MAARREQQGAPPPMWHSMFFAGSRLSHRAEFIARARRLLGRERTCIEIVATETVIYIAAYRHGAPLRVQFVCEDSGRVDMVPQSWVPRHHGYNIQDVDPGSDLLGKELRPASIQQASQ